MVNTNIPKTPGDPDEQKVPEGSEAEPIQDPVGDTTNETRAKMDSIFGEEPSSDFDLFGENKKKRNDSTFEIPDVPDEDIEYAEEVKEPAERHQDFLNKSLDKRQRKVYEQTVELLQLLNDTGVITCKATIPGTDGSPIDDETLEHVFVGAYDYKESESTNLWAVIDALATTPSSTGERYGVLRRKVKAIQVIDTARLNELKNDPEIEEMMAELRGELAELVTEEEVDDNEKEGDADDADDEDLLDEEESDKDEKELEKEFKVPDLDPNEEPDDVENNVFDNTSDEEFAAAQGSSFDLSLDQSKSAVDDPISSDFNEPPSVDDPISSDFNEPPSVDDPISSDFNEPPSVVEPALNLTQVRDESPSGVVPELNPSPATQVRDEIPEGEPDVDFGDALLDQDETPVAEVPEEPPVARMLDTDEVSPKKGTQMPQPDAELGEPKKKTDVRGEDQEAEGEPPEDIDLSLEIDDDGNLIGDDMYSREEAMDMLGLTEDELQAKVDAGELEETDVLGNKYYKKSKVEALMPETPPEPEAELGTEENPYVMELDEEEMAGETPPSSKKKTATASPDDLEKEKLDAFISSCRVLLKQMHDLFLIDQSHAAIDALPLETLYAGVDLNDPLAFWKALDIAASSDDVNVTNEYNPLLTKLKSHNSAELEQLLPIYIETQNDVNSALPVLRNNNILKLDLTQEMGPLIHWAMAESMAVTDDRVKRFWQVIDALISLNVAEVEPGMDEVMDELRKLDSIDDIKTKAPSILEDIEQEKRDALNEAAREPFERQARGVMKKLNRLSMLSRPSGVTFNFDTGDLTPFEAGLDFTDEREFWTLLSVMSANNILTLSGPIGLIERLERLPSFAELNLFLDASIETVGDVQSVLPLMNQADVSKAAYTRNAAEATTKLPLVTSLILKAIRKIGYGDDRMNRFWYIIDDMFIQKGLKMVNKKEFLELRKLTTIPDIIDALNKLIANPRPAEAGSPSGTKKKPTASQPELKYDYRKPVGSIGAKWEFPKKGERLPQRMARILKDFGTGTRALAVKIFSKVTGIAPASSTTTAGGHSTGHAAGHEVDHHQAV